MLKLVRHPCSLLVLLSVLGNLLLLMNPGYFNHDELQKLDAVTGSGLWAYAKKYARLQAGSEIGQPVRPIGFLWQGVVAKFMERSAAFAHAIDFVTHLGVVLLLYAVLRLFWQGTDGPLVAAALFSISPLTSFSVGWIGASMDRLYLFFSLSAVYIAFNAGLRVSGTIRASLVLIASAFAVLSKEAAIVLPVAIAGLTLYNQPLSLQAVVRALRNPCVWASAVAPIGLLALRLSALLSSVSLPEHAPYAIRLSNIGTNLWVYFYYPFAPRLTEAVNHVFLSDGQKLLATAAHIAVLVLVYRLFRFRGVLGYSVLYSLPLVSVLLIPSKGAHYLYASAVALSVALSLLAQHAVTNRASKMLVSGLIIVLSLHSIQNQLQIYHDGRCMSILEPTFYSSLRTLLQYRPAGIESPLLIRAEPQPRDWVLRRYFHGRRFLIGDRMVRVDIVTAAEGKAHLLFDRGCLLVPLVGP